MPILHVGYERALDAEGVDGENLISLHRVGSVEIREIKDFEGTGFAYTIVCTISGNGAVIKPQADP